ncbi:MAG: MerR family transcriptional regulator [Caulobacteraceae bacterium]|nr:MerR family transcriptional regulator [Caulobacteraceae bacterium]
MVRAMSVEALAGASGETIETILLCEREGLLGCALSDGRVRRYDPRALSVLRLVRLGQWLGVDFDTIRFAAPLADDPGQIRNVLRRWAQARLARLAREQRELLKTQRLLDDFLARSAAGEAADAIRVSRDVARLERELARHRGPEAATNEAGAKSGAASLRPRRARARAEAHSRRETSESIGL